MSRTAVIAGASGLVGGFLAGELARDARYSSVVALVRSPLRGGVSPRLEQVIVDFTRLDLRFPGGPVDLFCTLGTTIKKAGSQEAFRAVDHEAVLSFARWGLSQGAERIFIVTAMGAEQNSPIFYNRVKGETERDLFAQGFAEVHVFRPSLLVGPRTDVRAGERVGEVVLSMLSPFLIGSWRHYRAIKAQDVARAMIQASREIGAHRRKIYLSGEIQSMADAAGK